MFASPRECAGPPANASYRPGINDIAGNTGPMTHEQIEGHIASMAKLARANNISVVRASILPVGEYHMPPGSTGEPQTTSRPMARIKALNAWMKTCAAANGRAYLDYYSAIQTALKRAP